MLVLQQIAVLPKGTQIIIMDQNKIVLDFYKSITDGSLIFNHADEARLYHSVYSTFKCHELRAKAYTNNIFGTDDIDKCKIKYLIQIRGESDEG